MTKFIHDFDKQILFVFGNKTYTQKFLDDIMIKLFKFKEASMTELKTHQKHVTDSEAKKL